MNVKNIAGVTVGIVIAVVLFSSLLVPVVGSASHTGATEIINTGKNLRLIDSDVDMVITNQNNIIVGDETITGHSYPAIVSDNLWIAITNGGCNIFFYDGTVSQWSSTGGMNASIDADNKTIALTNIAPVGSNWNLDDTTSLDFTYDHFCYVATNSGDWVADVSASNFTINDMAQFRAVAFSGGNYITWDGPVKTSSGAVVSEDAITLNPVVDESELFTITVNDTPAPAWAIVPKTIYGESILSDSETQLLWVIPVLVAVGIIIGLVSMLFARRE